MWSISCLCSNGANHTENRWRTRIKIAYQAKYGSARDSSSGLWSANIEELFLRCVEVNRRDIFKFSLENAWWDHTMVFSKPQISIVQLTVQNIFGKTCSKSNQNRICSKRKRVFLADKVYCFAEQINRRSHSVIEIPNVVLAAEPWCWAPGPPPRRARPREPAFFGERLPEAGEVSALSRCQHRWNFMK